MLLVIIWKEMTVGKRNGLDYAKAERFTLTEVQPWNFFNFNPLCMFHYSSFSSVSTFTSFLSLRRRHFIIYVISVTVTSGIDQMQKSSQSLYRNWQMFCHLHVKRGPGERGDNHCMYDLGITVTRVSVHHIMGFGLSELMLGVSM